jgi:hypothetical protein
MEYFEPIPGYPDYYCRESVRSHGFQQPNVNKCLKSQRATHKGYTWRYA